MVLVVKDPYVNAGDKRNVGSIPGWGRSPGDEHDNPLQYSCLENPMERSLAGYSPEHHKESDTTEHAHMNILIQDLLWTHFHLFWINISM